MHPPESFFSVTAGKGIYKGGERLGRQESGENLREEEERLQVVTAPVLAISWSAQAGGRTLG